MWSILRARSCLAVMALLLSSAYTHLVVFGGRLLLTPPLVFSNSKVKAHPMPGAKYTMAPDVSMGIHWQALPLPQSYHACATLRLAFAFADAEEKRHPKNQDECVQSSLIAVSLYSPTFGLPINGRSKLLCVMAHRILHLEASLDIDTTAVPFPLIAPNGVPLPVAVGLLRGATLWSVLFMWRDKEGLPWRRLVEKENIHTATGFLHYTTCMYRLFCYGRLFKEALQSLLGSKVPTPGFCGRSSNSQFTLNLGEDTRSR